MNTHKVNDLMMHAENVFVGNIEDCCDFIASQSDFGYEIVPLTAFELLEHNEMLGSVNAKPNLNEDKLK